MRFSKTVPLAFLVAAVIAGSTVSAQAKPTVAVLGLEVIDDGGGIDAKITKFATDLTEALRKRAKLGAGPYTLAPNSNKDLLEMKLLSGCANEARNCMADIGKEIGSNHLIYGKVERRKQGYQVTLKLLDVESKQMERSTTELIAMDDTDAPAINKWSQRLYNRLTGQPDEGALVVKANVDTGTVFVDGESKGQLSGGTAQIGSLSEGKHEIRVESEGHSPFSREVAIQGGQTEEIKAELTKSEAVDTDKGDEEPGRPGGFSRAMFWTTAVLTAGGAAAFTITGLRVKAVEDEIPAKISEGGIMLDPNNPCADPNVGNFQNIKNLCDEGNSKKDLTNYLIIASSVTAVAAGFFYYKGYIAADKPKSREKTARSLRKKSKQPVVQFTPTVLPTYVGAGVQIDF